MMCGKKVLESQKQNLETHVFLTAPFKNCQGSRMYT